MYNLFRLTSIVDVPPLMKVPTAELMVPTAAPTFPTTFLPLVFMNFLALSNCRPIDFFFFFKLLPLSSRLAILTSVLLITMSELLPFPL